VRKRVATHTFAADQGACFLSFPPDALLIRFTIHLPRISRSMRARCIQPPELDCAWRGALVQASLEENGGGLPERFRGAGLFLRDVSSLIFHSDRVLQPVLKDMNRSGELPDFCDEELLARALST
jgi:hypothetical protein